MDSSVIPKQWHEANSFGMQPQMSSPKIFSYTLCCCGTGLSGPSAIVIFFLAIIDENMVRLCKNWEDLAAVFTVVDLDKIRVSHLEE
jgi:hypothetical protein